MNMPMIKTETQTTNLDYWYCTVHCVLVPLVLVSVAYTGFATAGELGDTLSYQNINI